MSISVWIETAVVSGGRPRPFTARDATPPPHDSASSSKTPDMHGSAPARSLICLIGGWDTRPPAWSSTTLAQTRSVVEHHLKPILGEIRVYYYQRFEPTSHPKAQRLTDGAFVFSAELDGSVPWLPNRVTKMFIDHRRRAGVGQFRLYDLRHFMATEMLAHGVAIVTVSERLGHARASTPCSPRWRPLPVHVCHWAWKRRPPVLAFEVTQLRAVRE